MKRNMDIWIQDSIVSDSLSAFPLMFFPGLGLINKKVSDLVHDPSKQAECLSALAARYPHAAAYVCSMDLSVEAEAFGSTVVFAENEVPAITGHIVDDIESARSLRIPDIGSGRTAIYLEAAAHAAKLICTKPLFGCHIGPLSLAGRLCDITELLTKTITDPRNSTYCSRKMYRFFNFVFTIF